MTLKQLATAVRNHVVDGLKGVSYTAFSIEQLEEEILLLAQTVMMEFSAKGIIDITKYAQRIDGIKLSCDSLSNNCNVESEACAPHFEIPSVNLAIPVPIPYMGTDDTHMTFKVYFDRDYRFHKYRLATGNEPFAWVSTTENSNGLFDVYLFNMNKYSNLKFIGIEAVFDNPYKLLNTAYFAQFSDSDFYAPAVVQDEILNRMTKKYIQYYRQFEKILKPNTQE
jgi:hypothetical protein